MVTVNDTYRTAEFLVSEAGGYRSRDQVTVTTTPALVAGQVLGRITTGTAASAAKAGNTGNATVGAITKGVNALPGVYQVVFSSATEFNVFAPGGALVGIGQTGTAFSAGAHLTFTITAGGTAMVVGDGFDITVAAGSGAYVALSATAINGSATVAGILYEGVPASFSGPVTIINAEAEVNLAHLTYDGTEAAVVAGLKALGIKAR